MEKWVEDLKRAAKAWARVCVLGSALDPLPGPFEHDTVFVSLSLFRWEMEKHGKLLKGLFGVSDSASASSPHVDRGIRV